MRAKARHQRLLLPKWRVDKDFENYERVETCSESERLRSDFLCLHTQLNKRDECTRLVFHLLVEQCLYDEQASELTLISLKTERSRTELSMCHLSRCLCATWRRLSGAHISDRASTHIASRARQDHSDKASLLPDVYKRVLLDAAQHSISFPRHKQTSLKKRLLQPIESCPNKERQIESGRLHKFALPVINSTWGSLPSLLDWGQYRGAWRPQRDANATYRWQTRASWRHTG